MTGISPFIPAFVTGAVALLGLIITKESKVSDFRQAWIDALRTEIANLLASIHTSLLILVDAEGTGIIDRDTLSAEARSALAAALRDANTALFTIRLRLNPKEADSIALLTTLDEIEDLSNDNDLLAGAVVSGRSNELEKTLTIQAKIVLSKEWTRVKKGEPYFVWARGIFAVFAAAAAIIVIVQAIRAALA